MNIKKAIKNLWNRFMGLSEIKKALLVCSIGFLIIVSRRPELVLNAQFWAEDLAVYYRETLDFGARSILVPYSGMLQTFPRLVALLLYPAPLSAVPLAYNLVAIGVMLLPLFILWSDRTLFGKEGPLAKLGVSILYLLLPGIGEIFGNLTNSLWFLAIASILVLVRKNPKRSWLVFDSVVLALTALTGPFGPILVVVAFFLIWAQRKKVPSYLWIKTAILVVCSIVQLCIYLQTPQQRTASLYAQKRAMIVNYQKPIQMTGMRFFVLPIAGKDVVAPGEHRLISRQTAEAPQVYMLGIFMLIITAIGFMRSRLEIRALIIFGALTYGISLIRAQTISIVEFWDTLQINLFGARYFFVPFVIWILLLGSLAITQKNWLRYLSLTSLAIYLLFFPFSFRVDYLKDFDFDQQIEEFGKVKQGDKYCFRINPGDSWTTCLKKR